MDNSFSFSRLGMIARFYGVTILYQLWLYAIVVIAFYVLAMLCRSYLGMDFIIWTLASMIFNWMMCLGPLAFYKYDDPLLTIQLPARGSEKALFITCYAFLIVPLFTVGVWTLCWFVGELLPVDNVLYSSFGGVSQSVMGSLPDIRLSPFISLLSNISSLWLVISVALFVVVSSYRNRVVKCILAVLGTKIAISIIGFIVGIVMTLWKIKDFSKGDGEFIIPDYRIEDGEFITSSFWDYVTNLVNLLSISGLIIAVVIFIFTWRKICRRQV